MPKRPLSSPFKNLILEESAVTEGTARISVTKGEVFYNPVQQFNRDLSISVISTFQKQYLDDPKLKKRYPGISIMEALSATGLRSIRYAKEIENVDKIIANDWDPEAVEVIRRNVIDNLGEGSKILPNHANAIHALHAFSGEKKHFDVVDLDPYGSAAPFLDPALSNIADGGLLCVTCTDTAVLCGSYPESCLSKYGSVPLKGDVCHEASLRILLAAVEASASRHKKHIIPLLSCSIDFYIRVFLRVVESAHESKKIGTRVSTVYRCVGCKSFEMQPKMTYVLNGRSEKYGTARLAIDSVCQFCSSRKEVAGPLWNGKLHDQEFVRSILATLEDGKIADNFGTADRIKGMLNLCLEELDNPLYLSLNEIGSIMKTSVPPLLTIKSALLNGGYKVSISHCNPRAIKTDAPLSVVWAAVSKWIIHNEQLDLSRLPEDSMARKIIAACKEHEIDLTFNEAANPPSRKEKLSRFPENPVANWGPLARARSAKL